MRSLRPSPLGNQAMLRRSATPAQLSRKCADCEEEAASPALQKQPALAIGAVDDPLEHEADRAADAVMRMEDPDVAAATAPPQVSRQCAACAEEETAGQLQAKTAPGSPQPSPPQPGAPQPGAPQPGAPQPGAPPIVHRVLDAPGEPLDTANRAFFEQRFGQDFSDVRVHTGASAAASATAVNAHAYTVGNRMVFARGQYAPDTERGRRLLAHELSHVVQQGGGVLRREAAAADASAPCPAAPTGLSDQAPAPACPTADFAGTTELDRWLFCLDSDAFAGAAPSDDDLDKIVADHPAKTRFLVNGNASTEGTADKNFRLACHRANKIAAALAAAIRRNLNKNGVTGEAAITAEIQSRIETATRGATGEFAGGLPANRLVVLYGQIPGDTVPDEAACKDAPRNLGDVKPENPCTAPTLDLAGMNGSAQLMHFHFCQQSDVLAATDASSIAGFAGRQAATATFVIHGFAHGEGDAEADKRLSCNRALRIARELMNAGVPAGQIREVSGLGDTDKFGEDAFNRVAIVLAEGGALDPVAEGLPSAKAQADKIAVRDAAVANLVAGKYQLAADTYLATWTCGHAATLRQAVGRLTINVPENDRDERLRSDANGVEEGADSNTVRLSNTALRAANAVECTMGRIVAMAFHQATMRDAPDALQDKSKRHDAALYMITLAGLSACTGKNAAAAQSSAFGPSGIDEPLADDPLANTAAPACAAPPQPTQLLPPNAAAKDRQTPSFSVYSKSFTLNDGALAPPATELEKGGLRSVAPAKPMVDAAAAVSVLGEPSVYADYEIGLIQTITDDLTLSEYVSGHRAVQKLPVPIRAAQTKGATPVPQPWTAPGAWAVPDAKGMVSLKASWTMDTPFAPFFNHYRPALYPDRTDFLDTLQRHTSIDFWLVARRRAAPLDRFSLVPIDGMTYEVSQNLDTTYKRQKGDLEKPVSLANPDAEQELFGFTNGQSRLSKTSDEAAPLAAARLDVPVASDVDTIAQAQILDAPPAPEAGGLLGGMSAQEYGDAITEILDHLTVFATATAAPGGGTNLSDPQQQPRLGFVYAPLDIAIDIDRASGRIAPPFAGKDGGANPVHVQSKELGDAALYHLSLALGLRLSKRDFLGAGRAAILSREALQQLPGDKDTARFTLSLPPYSQKGQADPNAAAAPQLVKDEPDISKDGDALREWAEMWACSEATGKSPEIIIAREFAKVYWMDRDGRAIKRAPDGDQYYTSSVEDDDKLQTNLPSPLAAHPGGFALGTVHTHPIDAPDRALPSEADLKMAKSGRLGRQHYIISEEHVVAYYSDGTQKDLGPRKSLLPAGVPCKQPLPDDK